MGASGQLGRIVPGADGDGPFLIEGSYLDSGPADWVADWGGIQMTFHSEHRPVEAYSRALEAAGLLIEAIRETRAPDAVVAARANAAGSGSRCSCTSAR